MMPHLCRMTATWLVLIGGSEVAFQSAIVRDIEGCNQRKGSASWGMSFGITHGCTYDWYLKWLQDTVKRFFLDLSLAAWARNQDFHHFPSLILCCNERGADSAKTSSFAFVSLCASDVAPVKDWTSDLSLFAGTVGIVGVTSTGG